MPKYPLFLVAVFSRPGDNLNVGAMVLDTLVFFWCCSGVFSLYLASIMHSINSPLKSNGILWTKRFSLLFSPTAQRKSSSEIQLLFRYHIFHDSPGALLSNSWPTVYTLVVFLWFRQKLLEGVVEKRISFHPGLEFPLRIHRSLLLFGCKGQSRPLFKE